MGSPIPKRKKPRRNEVFWSAAYEQPIIGSGGVLIELYADRHKTISAGRLTTDFAQTGPGRLLIFLLPKDPVCPDLPRSKPGA